MSKEEEKLVYREKEKTEMSARLTFQTVNSLKYNKMVGHDGEGNCQDKKQK